ncbi:ABC-2 type transport system permease protein [Geomicrobium halophilum]|uniref:ABC-2 type transport system permease protein n=1 Tax=Geomicrobium halophilum TaxID=549000 RepID=A0A841Q094_9BACL|nr:ABC-2 transporter permease [Geomicrobium halophilum]MBB6450983.1 ABC-2 type transport system permease protein [Geomicrobium halophilum]
MFNLIRRDVILQKRLLLTFLPFILFFIFMDVHPTVTFLVANIFIPYNAFYYDEKAETNILLNSLPYTRKEIIGSRYLGAIVYMVLAVGVTSLALFALNKPFTMTDIAVGSGLFLLFAALTFPLFYILKPGHITTVILFSFILLVGIGPPIMSFLAEHLTAITDFVANLSLPVLYTGAVLAIVTLYGVSWGVTTMIYQRKSF